MDDLSRVHFRAVRGEITGRFFSLEEANQLRQMIEDHTIIDPETRAAAAKAWESIYTQ
jgi:hypothetical protein